MKQHDKVKEAKLCIFKLKYLGSNIKWNKNYKKQRNANQTKKLDVKVVDVKKSKFNILFRIN